MPIRQPATLAELLQMGPTMQSPADAERVPPSDRSTWGPRTDGTPKGTGYFGVLTRPDGRVSSELSIAVHLDGRQTEIPALVPTLTPAQVLSLLAIDPANDEIPQSIVDKAVSFAKTRKQQGLPYFARQGEQQRINLPSVYAAPKRVP